MSIYDILNYCTNRKPPAGLVVLKKPSGGDEKLQVPHRVCTKVQKEDTLQPETGNRRENSKETL